MGPARPTASSKSGPGTNGHKIGPLTRAARRSTGSLITWSIRAFAASYIASASSLRCSSAGAGIQGSYSTAHGVLEHRQHALRQVGTITGQLRLQPVGQPRFILSSVERGELPNALLQHEPILLQVQRPFRGAGGSNSSQVTAAHPEDSYRPGGRGGTEARTGPIRPPPEERTHLCR
jgi:hypothetical protein